MTKRRIDRKNRAVLKQRKENLVRRQKQIALAAKNKDLKRVSQLQIGRMRSLDCRVTAVIAIANNQGGHTPGVDGIKWKEESDIVKAIEWLGEVINNPKKYQASARKTVRIPKPGTDEKRKLRIPTRNDRAAQMVYLIATDPVVECQSDNNSFGFRKNRSTADAVHLRRLRISSKWGPKYFRETDIAKCFDSISHKCRREITPNRPFIPLLDQWLKAGNREMKLTEAEEMGTPQGGVVSPILCNIALNGMEEHIRKYGCDNYNKGEVVRYADDIVITLADKANVDKVKEGREEFLKVRGLKLKETKTRAGHIEEGFDFLGWNLRRSKRDYRYQTSNTVSDMVFIMTPSKGAVERVKKKMRETIRENRSKMEMVEELNLQLKGWCQYYSSSNHSIIIFSKRDHDLYNLRTKWEKERNPNRTMKERHGGHKSGDVWTRWKNESGKAIFQPSMIKCSYPSYDRLNYWNENRKTQNPYLTRPNEVIKLV